MDALLAADHYRPHKSSTFEGYYSKFELPSGARFVLILCTVPGAAPGRRHNVTAVYVPPAGTDVWKTEIFPRDMATGFSADGRRFHIAAVDFPASLTGAPDHVAYRLEANGVRFEARSSSRLPWGGRWDTPAGLLACLPLPLHWHVHSLGSRCAFQLHLPREAGLPPEDRSGQAIVHEEKNWANSFPPAHNWLQARKQGSSICLAGGRTMGLDAFLVGYKNADLKLDLAFRPPFALRFCSFAPFMTHVIDWESRTFRFSVQDFWHKIEVFATAPHGTFFSLSSPMPEGFRDNCMGESLNASVTVRVFKAGGAFFGGWQLLCTDQFEKASLEFGGTYYPERGTDRTIN